MNHESADTSMKEHQLLSASKSENDNAVNTDDNLSGNVQPSQQVSNTLCYTKRYENINIITWLSGKVHSRVNWVKWSTAAIVT